MASCYQTRDIGSVKELLGRWQRIDDDFENCVVDIKKEGSDYIGELKICPYTMRLFGWKAGDIKWTDIVYVTANEFFMQDLFLAYDPTHEHICYTEYYPSVVKVSEGNLLIIDNSSSLQRWRRIAVSA